MMPKLRAEENQLLAEYHQLVKETSNFKLIRPELIANNPKLLRVFRLLMGKTLFEMGQLIGRNFVTVSQYELGKIRSMPLNVGERVVEVIHSNLPQSPSEEVLLTNLRRFTEKSIGGVLQAMRRAESMVLTKQEQAVANVLKKVEIPYRQHVTLTTKIGQVNVDFLVLGKLVIDCTASKSKWKAESLDFRAIKIKESYPNLKLMTVVPSDVDNGFIRRLIDFDFIVRDDEIASLITLV